MSKSIFCSKKRAQYISRVHLLASFTALTILSSSFQAYGVDPLDLLDEHSISALRHKADQGDPDAQYTLGVLHDEYHEEKGITQDYKKAFNYYQLAAKQNKPEAQHRLGLLYQNGEGIEQNYIKAFKYIKLSANQGYAGALCTMGHIHQVTAANSIDHIQREVQKEAIQYFKLSAAQNHLGAIRTLAEGYEYGIYGMEEDQKKAFKYFKQEADLGSSVAQRLVAERYETGNGVEQNNDLAFRYYELGADQGDFASLSSLGYWYFNGYHVEKNDKKAFEYYRLAADKGDSESALSVGTMYFYGEGIEKDPLMSLSYLYNVLSSPEREEVKALFLTLLNFTKDDTPSLDVEIQTEDFYKKTEVLIEMKKLEQDHSDQSLFPKPSHFSSIPGLSSLYDSIGSFHGHMMACYEQISENLERTGLLITCLQPTASLEADYKPGSEGEKNGFSMVKIGKTYYCNIGDNNPRIGYNLRNLFEEKEKIFENLKFLKFGLNCAKSALLPVLTKEDLRIKNLDAQLDRLDAVHTAITDGVQEIETLIHTTTSHRNRIFQDQFKLSFPD